MLGVRLLNGATQHRIMIFGPKAYGTYVVEFRTAWDAVLAISIPSAESGVIRYFQERIALRAVRAGRRISAPGR